jgi:hypothetical protein
MNEARGRIARRVALRRFWIAVPWSIVLIVLLTGAAAIRYVWTAVTSEWRTVSGLNKGELEYAPDGKLRRTDRDRDVQEQLEDYKRQQKYQRDLENERYRQGYRPGFRP